MYLTSTSSAILSPPTGIVDPDETPMPTPAPFEYTVQAGDTMSAIAARYGVSLDELRALNPGISPTSMSIGTVLRIPSVPESAGSDSTPAPAPVSVDQVGCHPTTDGGLWCFVLARNESDGMLENLSAQVTLIGEDEFVIASQVAVPPLNILGARLALPLATYFASPIAPSARPRVQILTANSVAPDDGRYLPAEIRQVLVQVHWLGHSAIVKGRVVLPEGSPLAGQVWVAATAYDESGQVVGMRTWQADAPLNTGGSTPFSFLVASLAGGIARVELAVEARP